MTAEGSPRTGSGPQEPVGDLVQRASQQLSQLVRDEMRLAQAEMTEKGKQALLATAIAALSLVLDVWAAALIVAGALAVITALMATLGRQQVGKASPPRPEQAMDSVKADVAEIKEKAQR
ncbi:phage holin family protein [Streptomyces xiangluensis]|uniref:Phage holin family protein n=1 Tax=Streptomyces xiangluensis TaxID=2665720 RepID=A0ABV8Z612_9ACTN